MDPIKKPTTAGIHFGNSNSSIGIFLNDNVQIIPNDNGNRTTPSYVSFTDSDILVGDASKNSLVTNPENTYYNLKEFIVNRGVGENEGRPVFNIKNNDVTPEELVSRILSYLRTAIIDDRGFEKNTQIQAVIAVPINFNDKQIKAYKYACEIAKMDILDVISEPKAAIYAYGFNSVINANILVLRIGGTSFDVSIHNVQPENNIILKSYYFSTKLGGNDFDERIFQYFANDFKKIRNIDILTNIRSVRRLKNACERSKRTLSSTNSASIVIDSLINGVDLCTNITRDKFNELCIDLFDQIVSTIGQQLIEVGLSKFEISEIVLVGGSSRIPKIKSIVEDFFEGKKTPLNSINPDEVIAYGAMAYAGSLDLNKE